MRPHIAGYSHLGGGGWQFELLHGVHHRRFFARIRDLCQCLLHTWYGGGIIQLHNRIQSRLANFFFLAFSQGGQKDRPTLGSRHAFGLYVSDFLHQGLRIIHRRLRHDVGGT